MSARRMLKAVAAGLVAMSLQACAGGACGGRPMPGSLGSKSCNQSCVRMDESKRTKCECVLECPCWRKHQ